MTGKEEINRDVDKFKSSMKKKMTNAKGKALETAKMKESKNC